MNHKNLSAYSIIKRKPKENIHRSFVTGGYKQHADIPQVDLEQNSVSKRRGRFSKKLPVLQDISEKAPAHLKDAVFDLIFILS